ncbi:MAG: hypothetical protein IT374_08790 [Polyangiaceae bacterium]|nr:hypothetical protein [Polyangiaceae bacterium]
MRRALAAAMLLAAACGAGPRTEAELKADLDAFVATRRACAADTDCVLASTSCPLGCGVAVSRAEQRAVEEKARELVAEYESRGRSCAYECVPVEARCQSGLCAAVSK